MKNQRKIKIVPYDISWPEFFENEAKQIQKILGKHLNEIYHIGSTAIPTMAAKPIIDIALECENLDAIDIIAKELINLDYNPLRRNMIPHRSFFTNKQDKKAAFNLHIFERGDPQIKRHVNFRDYLRNHPDDAYNYAELKKSLAEKHMDNRNAYVVGKDKLVQEIDTKAKLWRGRKKNYRTPHTGPLAKNWNNEKLIKAMEANLNIHMTHFAQYLNQVELKRIPGFTIVNSHLSDDTFNYVLDTNFDLVDTNNKISEVTNYFGQENTPFSWWVCPYDQPKALVEYLESTGYENSENNIGMYFNLDTWDEQNVSIPELKFVRAIDEHTLRDFALILTNDEQAFKAYFSWIASILTDDDPIEYYVGYVNNKPVVRGLTCYFAQVAGFYYLATDPTERKKGYGAAMGEYLLKRAKELGYHIGVLQASSEGHRLYQRLKFKECGLFREFKLKK